TAADASFSKPWKMLPLMMNGIKTEGPMAPEIDLRAARPAIDVHEEIVAAKMTELEAQKEAEKAAKKAKREAASAAAKSPATKTLINNIPAE
ncbi:MAG: hopanoid biosynthesis associated radical SAM protein HpnH, partial [Pseudomonadota bacterium]